MIDGVFQPDADGRLGCHEAVGLTPERVAKVQEQVRRRVLQAFVRRGLLAPEAAANRRGWEGGGGFSGEGSIRVEAHDRAGLERLLRYGARPALALERLAQAEGQTLIDRLPKALPDGRTPLRLTPLERLDRLAALIPPPRLHRHRYHGVRAPPAPGRAQVTAMAAGALAQAPPEVASAVSTADRATETLHRSPATSRWAMRLARIDEVFPLLCPRCGAPMRIIAFVTDTASVTRMLQPLGEPTPPPPVSPARGPPEWAAPWDQSPAFDPSAAAPAPAFQFDPTVSG